MNGQVDPHRVSPGDRASVKYWRGSRSGRRRTVVVAGHKEDDRGALQLQCKEAKASTGGDIDSAKITDVVRWYWPASTSSAMYFAAEGVTEADELEWEE